MLLYSRSCITCVSLPKRYLDLTSSVFITMSADIVAGSVTTGPSGVGDAVGMGKAHWFVAIVRNNTEKSVSEKLVRMGYECYLPLQEEYRVWKNGKRQKIERVVIPTIIFIHCTEKERKEIVSFPFISRFMTNKASSAVGEVGKPIAMIPDEQIQRLRFMLGNSDTPVTFSSGLYSRGDLVRVIRGKLAGLEGEVQSQDSRHSEIIVRIDCLGCACLTIATVDVEPVANQ